MHRFDAETEEIARLCLDYAIERLRLDPVPLDEPATLAELEADAGQTISAAGRSPGDVMALFGEVLAPTCISSDSPRFLAFIPEAPTKASQLFDVVVSASAIVGSSWMEASGAVYAENQALRWISDLAGLPAGAGGVLRVRWFRREPLRARRRPRGRGGATRRPAGPVAGRARRPGALLAQQHDPHHGCRAAHRPVGRATG